MFFNPVLKNCTHTQNDNICMAHGRKCLCLFMSEGYGTVFRQSKTLPTTRPYLESSEWYQGPPETHFPYTLESKKSYKAFGFVFMTPCFYFVVVVYLILFALTLSTQNTLGTHGLWIMILIDFYFKIFFW